MTRYNPDAEQAAVIAFALQGQGDARIGAGAGSGKTTTVAETIGAIIRAQRCPPSHIVATTFTAAAAQELGPRLIAAEPLARHVIVGTFHSLALRQLSHWDGRACWDHTRNVDVADARAPVPPVPLLWYSVLGWGKVRGSAKPGLDIDLRREGLTWRHYAQVADVFRSYGCTVEDGRRLELGADPTDTDPLARINPGVRETLKNLATRVLPGFFDAWTLYEEAKTALRAWDYADALEAYLDRLETGKAQDRAAFVFTDEAQDCSWVQLRTAKLLAQSGRLFLVFDTRQGIYGWRGADFDFVLNHEAPLLPLLNNYRSGSGIVDLGNAIAKDRPWHLGGDLRSGRKGVVGTVRALQVTVGMQRTELADGTAVPEAPTEAPWLVDVVRSEAETTGAWGSVAILARTNADLGILEIELAKASIPTRVEGRSFFDLQQVKSVLAYVTLIDSDSTTALAEIRNVPKRFLNQAWVDEVDHKLGRRIDLITAMRSARGAGSGVNDLIDAVERLRRAAWPQAMSVACGYVRTREPDIPGDDRGKVLDVLLEMAKREPSAKALLDSIDASRKARTRGSNADRVTLCTTHRAKGREWPSVLVWGPPGSFPHEKTEGDALRLDEERRLLYVAVTRARDRLTIAWPGDRPSTFIGDLIAEGALVREGPPKRPALRLVRGGEP